LTLSGGPAGIYAWDTKNQTMVMPFFRFLWAESTKLLSSGRPVSPGSPGFFHGRPAGGGGVPAPLFRRRLALFFLSGPPRLFLTADSAA
jgi:hypothetical protein